jgi:hypothetical protein
VSGTYPLPFGINVSGTYQFSRGVQNGGAGPSILAVWPVINPVANAQIGRTWTGVASRQIGLIREGLMYGDHDLHQVDMRVGKRISLGRAQLRLNFDAYNIFNSSWPFTVNSVYSTAPSGTWLRPTNVLQSRFFKLGGQFSF